MSKFQISMCQNGWFQYDSGLPHALIACTNNKKFVK